jgi:hypothetical protein
MWFSSNSGLGLAFTQVHTAVRVAHTQASGANVNVLRTFYTIRGNLYVSGKTSRYIRRIDYPWVSRRI